VVPGNNPVIANDDNATTDMNQPIVINVIGNDVDAENQLVPNSVSIVTNPSNGSVTINTTTGEITYTPNNGFFGSDNFSYTICDGGAPATCDTANVNIIVNENVGIDILNDGNYHVFFNENVIIIQSSDVIDGSFKLYNSTGMLVLDGKLTSLIPLNAASGVYYMEIQREKGLTYHKLLKN
jgi:hypothetical protein